MITDLHFFFYKFFFFTNFTSSVLLVWLSSVRAFTNLMIYSSNGKGDSGLENSDSGEKCTNLQSVTVVETEETGILVMPIEI